MQIGPTQILDTYAEAFGARYTRLIITAADDYWLDAALASITGYGTSVLGCDAEAGVEQRLPAAQSPDGRPAAAVLLFAFTTESVTHAAQHRVAQCILTCPSTAFDTKRQEEVWRLLSADRDRLLTFCRRHQITVGRLEVRKTLKSPRPLYELQAVGQDADAVRRYLGVDRTTF